MLSDENQGSGSFSIDFTMTNVQWFYFCTNIYEVLCKSDTDNACHDHYVSLFEYILMSDSSHGQCNILQLISRLLKHDRHLSHPERKIGKANAPMLPLTVEIGILQFNKLLIQRLLNKFQALFSSWRRNISEPYVNFFLICTVVDIYKSTSSAEFSPFLSLSFETMHTILVTNHYTPSVLKCIDFIMLVINSYFTKPLDNILFSFQDKLAFFSKLDALFMSIHSRTHSALSDKGSGVNDKSLSCSCSLIDESRDDAVICKFVLVLSTFVNAGLKTLASDRGVDAGQPSPPASSSSYGELIKILVHFHAILLDIFTSRSSKQLLLLLSENDQELILCLHQLLELQCQLELLAQPPSEVQGAETTTWAMCSAVAADESLSQRVECNRPCERSLDGDCSQMQTPNQGEIWTVCSAMLSRLTASDTDAAVLFLILINDCLCADVSLFADLLASPETVALQYLLRVTRLLLNPPHRLPIACDSYTTASRRNQSISEKSQEETALTQTQCRLYHEYHRDDTSLDVAQKFPESKLSVIWIEEEGQLGDEVYCSGTLLVPQQTTVALPSEDFGRSSEEKLHWRVSDQEWARSRLLSSTGPDSTGPDSSAEHAPSSSDVLASHHAADPLEVLDVAMDFCSRLSLKLGELSEKNLFPCNTALLCHRLEALVEACSDYVGVGKEEFSEEADSDFDNHDMDYDDNDDEYYASKDDSM